MDSDFEVPILIKRLVPTYAAEDNDIVDLFQIPPLDEREVSKHTINSLLEKEYSDAMEEHLRQHNNILNILNSKKTCHLKSYQKLYDRLYKEFHEAIDKKEDVYMGYCGNADADSFILNRYEDLAVRDFVKYARSLGYQVLMKEKWVHTIHKYVDLNGMSKDGWDVEDNSRKVVVRVILKC